MGPGQFWDQPASAKALSELLTYANRIRQVMPLTGVTQGKEQ
jgi:hypothetical protein